MSSLDIAKLDLMYVGKTGQVIYRIMRQFGPIP
jgi:hypothetical protein